MSLYTLTLTLPVGPIPKTREEKRGFVRQVLQVIKTKPLTAEESFKRRKAWENYYGVGHGSIKKEKA